MTRGSGNITRRGKHSWRLKFEAGRDPVTGERRTEFVTLRGTKKDAQAELIRRLNAVEEGQHVAKTSATLADYARHWLDTIIPARTSAKTRERYRELVEKHIIPQIGAVALQKLDGERIDAFYNHLRRAGRRDGKGGLSPQTVLHIHRLLSQILASAVRAKKIRVSPIGAVQTTPKARKEEVQILDDEQLARLFRHLEGRPLRMPVILAASTGMRRGEVLGLQWKDVDLDAGTIRVTQVVELTKAGIALKAPKTDRSRRTITLPARLVQELRVHRREQAEARLRLGLGRDDRDLVFPSWDWGIRNPGHFTKEFSREVAAAGLSHITLHSLRHGHVSVLLRSGVPVNVVAARVGHANPTVTLNIYAHLLPGQQEGAAAVMDAALRTALEE
jgi:integrase